MVLRNLELTESSGFAELFRDKANHTCRWFKSRTVEVDGYYLPPSLDLIMYRECLLIVSGFEEDQNQDMFLVWYMNL